MRLNLYYHDVAQIVDKLKATLFEQILDNENHIINHLLLPPMTVHIVSGRGIMISS